MIAFVDEILVDGALMLESHWLDVEDSYRAAGWHVRYDRPGYNEPYEPTFTFKRGAQRG